MPLELEWRRPGASARLVNPAGRRRTRASVGSAHFKLLENSVQRVVW